MHGLEFLFAHKTHATGNGPHFVRPAGREEGGLVRSVTVGEWRGVRGSTTSSISMRSGCSWANGKSPFGRCAPGSVLIALKFQWQLWRRSPLPRAQNEQKKWQQEKEAAKRGREAEVKKERERESNVGSEGNRRANSSNISKNY